MARPRRRTGAASGRWPSASRRCGGGGADHTGPTGGRRGGGEPSLWRELAEYQRDQGELAAIVASAVRVADEVEAPVQEEIGRQFAGRMRLVSVGCGWAAAAAVLLAWSTGSLTNRQQATIGNQTGLVHPDTRAPQEVVDGFVKDGKISPTDLYQT